MNDAAGSSRKDALAVVEVVELSTYRNSSPSRMYISKTLLLTVTVLPDDDTRKSSFNRMRAGT